MSRLSRGFRRACIRLAPVVLAVTARVWIGSYTAYVLAESRAGGAAHRVLIARSEKGYKVPLSGPNAIEGERVIPRESMTSVPRDAFTLHGG